MGECIDVDLNTKTYYIWAMRFYWLLLASSFLYAQPQLDTVQYAKNHISVGLFDHKVGASLIGYSRTIFHNGNNEVFLGFGTLLAVNTVAVGVKKDLWKSKLDKVFYSVFSIKGVHGIAGLDDFVAPNISIGLDIPLSTHKHKNLWLLRPIKDFVDYWEIIFPKIEAIKKQEFFNIGISSTFRMENKRIRLLTIPYLNFSYRW